MKREISLRSFKITDITLAKEITSDPELKSVLPDLIPQHCSFIIDGVNNAESNALRRVVMGELPVYHLGCEYENISTNDKYIIGEMLQKRLQMIPIKQDIDPNLKFSLEYDNKSATAIEIPTSYIVGSKKVYFDQNIQFLILGSGCYIKIAGITVQKNYPYTDGYGMVSLAIHSSSIVQDVNPPNVYVVKDATINTNKDNTVTTLSSTMADPKRWKIEFDTNGTIDPAKILKMACDAIIERVTAISDLLQNIESDNDLFTLNIPNETHTIGNLLVKTISDMYPDIKMATYHVPTVGRTVIVKIRTDDDINIMYGAVIKHIVSTFNKIKSLF